MWSPIFPTFPQYAQVALSNDGGANSSILTTSRRFHIFCVNIHHYDARLGCFATRYEKGSRSGFIGRKTKVGSVFGFRDFHYQSPQLGLRVSHPFLESVSSFPCLVVSLRSFLSTVRRSSYGDYTTWSASLYPLLYHYTPDHSVDISLEPIFLFQISGGRIEHVTSDEDNQCGT